MQRSILFPGTLAALLLLTGCSAAGAGGSGGPSAPGSSTAASGSAEASGSGGGGRLPQDTVMKDPCSVISTDEVSAAYGGGISEAQGETGTCVYSGTANAISVLYAFGGDQMWDILRLENATAIDGVGNRAEGYDGAVSFQKGNWVVGVSQAAGDAASTPRLTALAKAIAAKL